jgi:hypothetical protein
VVGNLIDVAKIKHIFDDMISVQNVRLDLQEETQRNLTTQRATTRRETQEALMQES